jgi:hypothetical protein
MGAASAITLTTLIVARLRPVRTKSSMTTVAAGLAASLAFR